MKVSVVIPAFNEEKLLPGTLAAVTASAAAFARRNWAWELIVCDNNSTDQTAAVARAAGARVVFEPINQIARARNAGARAAQGEWLLFLDADSQPSEALLESLAAALEDPRVAGGGATMRFDSTVRWGRLAACLWNRLSRLTRWAAGSFIFCPAETFHALGGFDEQFFVAEEIDFSRRLKRWARRQRRRVVILTGHPLLTSGRKAHLYTLADHLRFLSRVLYLGRRLYQSREHCGIWYDGRR